MHVDGSLPADFDGVLAAVQLMTPAEREAVAIDAISLTGSAVWVPNPGPQTDAYYSEADVILYGGSAGCGKTGLLVGLSMTAHKRTLFLRRTNKEASKIRDAYEQALGHSEGWNGQDDCWRLPDGRLIQVGGCQMEDDKQKYKGTPYDLYAFDEISDFTESQFTFITTWNRSTDKNQRCRVVAASNPPTTEEGMWLTRYWAPWLDPNHSNPAKPGELRWFLDDKEVDGPGPHLLDGKPTMAQSRTFIPGKLSDNPDLAQTNYDATLARLPVELRRAYRDGSFMISGKRDAFQVFDPEWVRAAFRRWSPIPPHGSVMSSIACDIAQGGEDNAVLAMRYGYWFDRLRKKPGKEMTKGSDIAGFVLSHRLHNCPVTLDLTGGYGGAAYEIMKSNDIEVYGFQGTAGSTKLTKDGQYKFPNRRCEIYWMLREALDPDQPGGSQIALPESRQLFEDLTILRWEPTIKGIQITPKERVVELLNRSPDEGDAVAICWSRGIKVYKPNIEFNALEQGLSSRPSTIVDLGTRRQLSIVGGRRR